MAISRDIRCGPVHFNLRDITVEPVLFLYMFAVNVVLPTLQALAYFKVCIQRYNASFCQQLRNVTFQQEHSEENDYVQSTTSHWILLANVAMTIPACFTVMLFLGSFGDKVGRKFPVVLPILGAVAQSLASLLNAVFPYAPLGFLLIGPLLSGMCGGIIAALMAVFSYITHVAPPETKTTRIGILESMIFLAGTLGVFTSGVMLDGTSFTFVFGFSAGLQCLALVYVVVWLEDVRPPEPVVLRSMCGRWAWESLKEVMQFVRRPRAPRVRLTILLLVLSIDLILLCTVGELDILLLFLRREPLAWSQTLFGYFKGLENLLRGLVLMVALPLLKRKLRVRDTSLVLGGLVSKVAGLVLLGLATHTWMVFCAGVVSMGQGLPSVGIRSMSSSLVKRDEQGRLFSVVAASESVVAVLAALLFNTVYPESLHFFPGFSFIMAAIISLAAFFIVLYLHRTGTAELCTPQPFDRMAEETDTEHESSSRDEEDFHIAEVASEDHFGYIT
ncbi:proton-coupled folate transporter-like [Babylonia areolata]|uniref:proton-coupled folate transporter-like n=1 Tax=Babylonia areolata TaxID=304850 RepID=UPI003FD2227B